MALLHDAIVVHLHALHDALSALFFRKEGGYFGFTRDQSQPVFLLHRPLGGVGGGGMFCWWRTVGTTTNMMTM